MMKLKVNLFFIIEEFSKYFNGIWDKVCGSTEKKKFISFCKLEQNQGVNGINFHGKDEPEEDFNDIY